MAARCIRGAVTVDNDTAAEVWAKTESMLGEIIRCNNIAPEDIISILFTATNDIRSAYPAVAARKMGITEASLMCAQEMYVEGSLRRCIRAEVTIESGKSQSGMRHVYLGGAQVLRPDLVKKSEGISVAIDGPAGSGKSTVAKLLAEKYNLIYVDTGAMYRAVGLYCMEHGIDPDSRREVSEAMPGISVNVENSMGMQRIFLDGRDVTSDIRTQEAAAYASKVAAIPEVRSALVAMQREIAKNSSVIMDGRDIGTNVLTDARVKVYLDADAYERARRRCRELEEKGIKADIEKIAEEIRQRDEYDKNRQCNPLTAAADAVIINTTDMDIEQVQQAIGSLIEKAQTV